MQLQLKINQVLNIVGYQHQMVHSAQACLYKLHVISIVCIGILYIDGNYFFRIFFFIIGQVWDIHNDNRNNQGKKGLCPIQSNGLFPLMTLPAGFIYNYSLDYGSRCMMQLVAVVVTAALIAIYRPYKSGWINSLDIVIFLDLGLLIALSSYQFHLTEVNLSLSIWVYVVQLILIFIPFIWITLYIGARVVAVIVYECLKPDRNEEENPEEVIPINVQNPDAYDGNNMQLV